MSIITRLKQCVWLDLATGATRHWTKGKLIGLAAVTAKVQPGQRALDLGCGDGFWSRRLASAGYQVTSVDHEKYYTDTQLVDLEKPLPFASASFDLVWSTEVIEHVYHPDKLVGEIKRVLKPGGLLMLTTPNSFFWLYAILRLFGYKPADVQNPDHKQFFHYRDICHLLPRAKIYGFFPYALIKLRLRHPALISFLSPTLVIVEQLTNPQNSC